MLVVAECAGTQAEYALQFHVSIERGTRKEKAMQAVMKVAPGVGNVELREIAEPEPPPGHVVIEVRAAGICGTDLHIYHDEFRTRPPVVIGHEVAGTVAAIGAGIEHTHIGERVT